jgi:hypothetical protein
MRILVKRVAVRRWTALGGNIAWNVDSKLTLMTAKVIRIKGYILA